MPKPLLLCACFTALLVLSAPMSADTPVLRVAVQEAGTVNWEIDTIDHNGFDTANGFEMQVQAMAGGPASQVAFQGGEADVIVSDWIWVARQRAAGNDFVFLPYSKAVGGLMVRDDNPRKSLADFRDSTIGIAGGPLDKSWIILRAYAENTLGMDLAKVTKQVFGAPPLIFKAALDGEVDGAVNYWHFMARMKAAGMVELISVADAAVALGLDPDTPLLGYVFKGDMLRDSPELIEAFAAASRASKDLLATDDAAWERLRPMMPANTEAEFEALKEGYRTGIPGTAPVDLDNARAVFALMARLGGAELVGSATEMPEGVFLDVGR